METRPLELDEKTVVGFLLFVDRTLLKNVRE
jgi:hypothetical protein